VDNLLTPRQSGGQKSLRADAVQRSQGSENKNPPAKGKATNPTAWPGEGGGSRRKPGCQDGRAEDWRRQGSWRLRSGRPNCRVRDREKLAG